MSNIIRSIAGSRQGKNTNLFSAVNSQAKSPAGSNMNLFAAVRGNAAPKAPQAQPIKAAMFTPPQPIIPGDGGKKPRERSPLPYSPLEPAVRRHELEKMIRPFNPLNKGWDRWPGPVRSRDDRPPNMTLRPDYQGPYTEHYFDPATIVGPFASYGPQQPRDGRRL
jgi:hypothetical protein